MSIVKCNTSTLMGEINWFLNKEHHELNFWEHCIN